MIKYKIDILQHLKDAGYTTYKLRKEKLLGEATIQKLRNNELVSWENINIICNLLNYNLEDVILHERDSK